MEQFEHEYDLEKAVLVTPTKRDFKMLVTPRYVGHYRENTYEEFTADLLSNTIKDGTCFIDVGAHSGFYSLLVGSKNVNSRIIAFEPVPETFSLLQSNLELNGLTNVQTYNLAVSDRDETKIFNITEASDSAGFYQHPLTTTIRTIEVKTVALDNFLDDLEGIPVVVKIDTEGHEFHVLEGMKTIIKETKDIRLLVEFNPGCLTSAGFPPERLLEKIEQLGFEMFFIDDQCKRTYRLGTNRTDSWSSLIADKIYVNLLCIKKETALSVLFFSHSSHLLGAEQSLLELTSELVRDHGAVCSIVLPNDGPLRQQLEKVGACTLVLNYSWWCDLSLPTKGEISSRLGNSLKVILQQIGELQKINPDVVLTNTLVIPWGAIAASFLSRPHVWFIQEFGKLDHDLKFYLSFQTILRFIRDSSNLILTNSNAVRQTLFGKVDNKNIATVYYNVEIPFDPLNQNKGRSYFTRPNSTKLIITGNITESKGQEDAILAVKELALRKKDVQLIVMGIASPWYLGELKRIVKDWNLGEYVKFHEFSESPHPVVNEADIVLVCSKNEAFGRVTVEAMLLKKPVVGTNSGGTRELIREGYNGLLYEPGDYRQLADKIEYLIEHEQKIKELGENGCAFAKATFTREKYGGEVCKVLCDLKSVPNISTSPFFSFLTEGLADLQAEAEAERQMLATERDRLTHDVAEIQSTVQAERQMLATERDRLTHDVAQIQSTVQAERQMLATERDQLTHEISLIQSTVQRQQRTLGENAERIAQLAAEREGLTQQLVQLQSNIQSREELLAQTEKEITRVVSERKRLSQQAFQLQATLQTREQYVWTIENSLAWALLVKYRRVRDKFCPDGTGRRQMYNAIKDFVKKLVLGQVSGPKHQQMAIRNARVGKLASILGAFSGRPLWVRHPTQIPSAVSLASSGLFQSSWYFQKNKDVAESGMSAIFHYLLYGAKEGRDPNPFFDTSWYLTRNRDVASSGMNPLIHYLRHGAREERDPSPSFDTSYYLEHNADVATLGMNPLVHYLKHGLKEGRAPRAPEVAHNSSLSADLDPVLAKPLGPEPNSTPCTNLRLPPPGPPWVLVIADRVPTPDMTSGSVRLSAILQLMHELGLRISFISALRKEEYRFILEPGSELGEYEERLRSLGIGEVNYGWDDAIQELEQNGWRYRFAFLSFAEITYRYLPLVRASGIHAKIIYDTVDLHALRLKREAEVNGNQELVEKGAYYQKIELCNIQCTDAVIAISDEEAARIREMAPQARVATIPNIHTTAPGKASMQTRQDLLFIGHYLHTPNVDAVTFFVREILPRVRKVLPKVTIRLVGSNMPEAVRALKQPGVLPIGYAKDVRPYFDSSRIFVAPLRYGAGMKGKIGHAMSWGLPVVTTSIGAEGMDLISSEHALIADSPDAFADAVIRLYNDPKLWQQISQAAAKHMRDRFSDGTVRPILAKLFTENFYADNDADGNRDGELTCE